MLGGAWKGLMWPAVQRRSTLQADPLSVTVNTALHAPRLSIITLTCNKACFLAAPQSALQPSVRFFFSAMSLIIVLTWEITTDTAVFPACFLSFFLFFVKLRGILSHSFETPRPGSS